MNIVVLCGGTSTEREVSLNSGSMVCDALRSIGHNAVLLDVFFGNENKNLLDVSDFDVQAEKEKLQKLSNMPAGRYCIYGSSWFKWSRWKMSGCI